MTSFSVHDLNNEEVPMDVDLANEIIHYHYATTTADDTEMVDGEKVYFCHACSAPFPVWTDDWSNRVVYPCDKYIEAKRAKAHETT